jgi:hypothetical protein
VRGRVLIVLVLVLVLVFAACADGARRDSAPPKPTGGVQQPPKGPPKPLDASAFGSVPARIPGVLSQLQTGMTLDELRAIAPWLVPSERQALVVESGIAGVRYQIKPDSEMRIVEQIIVELPDDGRGAAAVKAAWGPGEAGTCVGLPCVRWYDHARLTRVALLDDHLGGDLEVSTYLTPEDLVSELARVIGASPDHLGLGHPAPVLMRGDAGDALFYSFPAMFERRLTTPVLLMVSGGKVVYANANVDGTPDERARMIAVLDGAFGRPAGAGLDDTGVMRLDAERGLRVVVDDANQLAVTVTPYVPLAKLLGDLETAPFLGKTVDVLRTSYAFDGDVLELPGTEYCESTSVFLRLDAGGRVDGFVAVLNDILAAERARDAVLAALAKKFGKGKGDDYEGIVYRANPRISARFEVNGQWLLEVGTASR